jgi:thiamine-phosphate pyrophosphorylase
VLRALRVLWITDDRGDAARVVAIARAAVAGGLRALQVRERGMSARALAGLCERLLPVLEPVGGLLFVNDRADLAAAGLAHGVQLRGDSLAALQVRRFLPAAPLGVSVHGLDDGLHAAAGGADFALLGPVFATASKPGVAPLGAATAAAIAQQLPLPVLWLGGITAANAAEWAPYRPAGIAVMRAIADAADPGAVAQALAGALAAAGAAPS